EGEDRERLLPTHINLGPWLRGQAGVTNANSPGLCGCFVCTATNHAPIGEYQERFFPREPPQGCHGVLNTPETRAHILNHCSWYAWRANHYEGGIETVMGLNLFLMDNPHAFSFDRAVQPRLFDQDWKAY